MKQFEQNGVTYFYDKVNYYRKILDIDVKPGIKTVEFSTVGINDYRLGVDLSNITKTFPEVEEIKIGPYIMSMDIPNRMFPNVKKVTSFSSRYLSDTNVLVDKHNGILLNAFCKKEGEKINLKTSVRKIRKGALDGTETNDIEAYTQISYLEESQLYGYKEDESNIKQLAGTIYRIDGPVADLKDFKDMHISQKCTFNNLEKIVCYNYKQMTFLRCKEIELIDDSIASSQELAKIIHSKGPEAKIIVNSKNFTTDENGVIYSADRETLVSAASMNCADLEIPEGVEKIEDYAFYGCECGEITLPSTLRDSGEMMFNKIKCLKINNGVKMLHGNMIANSIDINYIKIPESVSCIGKCFALNYSGVIELSEGLIAINKAAFLNITNRTLKIPSTVHYIGEMNFLRVKEFVLDYLPKGFVHSFTKGDFYDDFVKNENYSVKIVYKGKEFFVPRFIRYADKIEAAIISGDVTTAAMTLSDIDDPIVKFKTAVEIYEQSHIPAVKDYIRKAGGKACVKLLKEKDPYYVTKVLRQNVLTDNAAKAIIKAADNYPEIKTYALVNTQDKSKGGFSL